MRRHPPQRNSRSGRRIVRFRLFPPVRPAATRMASVTAVVAYRGDGPISSTSTSVTVRFPPAWWMTPASLRTRSLVSLGSVDEARDKWVEATDRDRGDIALIGGDEPAW